jgi:hypothetical protein
MRCREMLSFKDISGRYFCEDKNEVHDRLTKVNILPTNTQAPGNRVKSEFLDIIKKGNEFINTIRTRTRARHGVRYEHSKKNVNALRC